MADFDEYRTKYIYVCPFCKEEITAFRNCGNLTPCRCGKDMLLKKTIEPKTIEYNGKDTINIKTFKPYFDVTLGHEVTSEKEIKEYCAKNNCVYAGDKELTQQCEQNKRENEKKFNERFTEGCIEQIMQRCF